jgi:hypothetical protein
MVCWLITKLYGHHQRIVRTSRERRSIRNEKKDGTLIFVAARHPAERNPISELLDKIRIMILVYPSRG